VSPKQSFTNGCNVPKAASYELEDLTIGRDKERRVRAYFSKPVARHVSQVQDGKKGLR
jgi:hypothetical protein